MSAKNPLSSIPLESVVRAHCTMTMMSVLTDVGLRENKAWSGDEQELLDKLETVAERQAEYINAEIEAARAKDAELIQQLINCLKNADRYGNFRAAGPYRFDDKSEQHRLQQYEAQAIAAASAAGFKPSEQ